MNDAALVLSLVSLVLVAPAARALPTQDVYQARGSGPPRGKLYFELDEDVLGACRYEMTWEFGSNAPGETCFVDERVPTSGGCFRDATVPLSTIVTLAPNVDCWGFDGTGQAGPVSMLVFSERASDGALTGLIQLNSAAAAIVPLDATPMR